MDRRGDPARSEARLDSAPSQSTVWRLHVHLGSIATQFARETCSSRSVRASTFVLNPSRRGKEAFLRIPPPTGLPKSKIALQSNRVLFQQFGLDPDTHEEFAKTFRENCQYLGITSGVQQPTDGEGVEPSGSAPGTVTLAEGAGGSALTAFVILPFVERDSKHPKGFFLEVLRSLITPAAASKECGFTVKTANRQGSDMIQSTIVNDLIEADLVIADLTEHNPNVMFELGVRMAQNKPVVLMKAEGTGPLFDVDNMLRVFEYSPNLWYTTIEKDQPNLRDFIKGAWENRDPKRSYLNILRGMGKA